MIVKTAVIAATAGLHARAAATFAHAAARAPVPVEIATAREPQRRVAAASLLGLMSLDVAQGDEVLLWAQGEHAEDALTELVALLEGRD